MHNLLQVIEWSNQKFVGLGLQVYGLAIPPGRIALSGHVYSDESSPLQQLIT